MSEKTWTGTWCPQCGPDVAVDEDGCCAGCGCDAVGEGAEKALRTREEFRRARKRIFSAYRELSAALGSNWDHERVLDAVTRAVEALDGEGEPDRDLAALLPRRDDACERPGDLPRLTWDVTPVERDDE